MSLLKSQTTQELDAELSRVENTPAGIQAATEQARELVDGLQKLPKVDEKSAKLLVLGIIAAAAEAKGGTLEQVWESYPQELKNLLSYTPEDLKKNQKITMMGTTASLLAFVGSFLLGGVAVLRAAPLAAKYLPLMLKASRAGRAVEAGNLFNMLRTAIGLKIAMLGVSSAFLGAIGFAINMAVNNWNDVFHWGPTLGLSSFKEILGLEDMAAIKAGDFAKPTFVPTRTKSKSAKLKMFVGTVMGGRVADVPEFVRTVDDEITDEQDMIKDAVINMHHWLKAFPGMLTYEIQVKNNPFDENNVKRIGTWISLDMYITNKWNKRTFLDSFLLGPTDPIKYYPDKLKTESIRMAITEDMIPVPLIPRVSADGKIRTVDKKGNVVDVFPDEKEEISEVPAYAPPAEKPAEPIIEPPKIVEIPEISEPVSSEYSEARAQVVKLRQGGVYTYGDMRQMYGEINKAERENRKVIWLKMPFVGPELPKVVGPEFPIPPETEIPPTLPTPETPPSADVVYTNDSIMKVNTPGSHLNFRSGGYLASSKIGKLPHGSKVIYRRKAGFVDGYQWAMVTEYGTTKSGFVARKYLVNV